MNQFVLHTVIQDSVHNYALCSYCGFTFLLYEACLYNMQLEIFYSCALIWYQIWVKCYIGVRFVVNNCVKIASFLENYEI